jgi:hypothetical protein
MIVSEMGTALQYNLFTGELEPLLSDEVPETGWLFDPDFGVVLPEDRAGREVAIGQGVTLAFPAIDDLGVGRFHQKKSSAAVGNVSSATMVANGSGPLVYGKSIHRHPDPDPWVAQTEDAAQLIISGFGIYLAKKVSVCRSKSRAKLPMNFLSSGSVKWWSRRGAYHSLLIC